MVLINRITLVGLIALIVVTSGCSYERPDGLAQDDEPFNFTLTFQCGNDNNLPLTVSGDVRLDVHAFTRSNCSVHSTHGNVTVICPKEVLSASLPEEVQKYYAGLNSTLPDSPNGLS